IRIKQDFPVTDVEYGFINAGFLVSYAVMFTLGGILIDRYGSRLGLSFSVGIWSLASMLHSLASNALHFGIFRFFLGLGEGGAFPGAVKAVVEWVPKKRQALANGIAIGGSALGAVAAPPLCVYLIGLTGWRGVFVITGAIGFMWVIAWLLFPKYAGTSNLTDIELHSETNVTNKNREKHPGSLLRTKEAWIFIVIRFILDPIFYFYMFWIPKYLNEVRGVSITDVGRIAWIPFLAMGISNMLGGWISDFIYRKTSRLNLSRKAIMGFAALLTLAAIFVKYAGTPGMVIVIMCTVFFAHGLWITNYITSITDIFGKSSASTVIGFSGSAGAISSLVINPLIGLIVTSFSYDPLWLYSGLMYPVAFIIFMIFIPRIEPVRIFLIDPKQKTVKNEKFTS
ncbi:MAG: MFS transporter, partial [Bacteroidales bacterium]|nr:MFS transporter [Bacteroidales bacterium]